MEWLILTVGIVGLGLSALLWRALHQPGKARFTRLVRVVLLTLALLVSLLVATAGTVLAWYYNRPQPEDTQQILFEGITYQRVVSREPRPVVLHIVTIDLTAPGIGFFVTPPELDGEFPLRARTTSQFLREFDVQLAINGDFFSPFHSNGVIDYYPHVGDPVTVSGLGSSDGAPYGRDYSDRPTLYFTGSAVTLEPAPPTFDSAISGKMMLAEAGVVTIVTDDPDFSSPNPRTAIGLSEDRSLLFFFVVDGRQPNYSEGVSLPEMAQIALDYGAYDVVNLDGGGSATLVIADAQGEAVVLNTPVDSRIPGRERAVANHLGVFANRVE